jgi:hypothetical protein
MRLRNKQTMRGTCKRVGRIDPGPVPGEIRRLGAPRPFASDFAALYPTYESQSDSC